MKTYLVLLCFYSLTLNSLAQNPTFSWVKQIGGSGVDFCPSIAVDSSGNIYLTGFFADTVDFDPSPTGVFDLASSGGYDIFIAKLDSGGNLVWARQIGGAGSDMGNSLALDASGHICLAGHFEQIVDFDPGPGVTSLTAAGSMNIFICKLDTSGNFIWVKKIGGGTCNATSMTLDPQDKILFTGPFTGTVDFNPGPTVHNLVSTSATSSDAFVCKLDTAGDYVWAVRVVSGSVYGAYGTSIAASASSIFVTGIVTILTNEMFNARLNSIGSIAWTYTTNALGERAIGNGVAVDGAGNAYGTGQFTGTVDFDFTAGINRLTAAGVSDVAIFHYAPSSAFLWAKQIGGPAGDYGRSIALDPAGNIYLTGAFSDTADFDPGPGIYPLNSAGFGDVFISKYDALGNFSWAKQLSGQVDEAGYCVKVDATGNVFTAGTFTGTTDFDPEAPVYNLSSHGGPDIFIHKMSQPAVTGTLDLRKESIFIYPNPASRSLFIRLPDLGGQHVDGTLSDLAGRVILEFTLKEATHVIPLDCAGGVYLLRLSTADRVITQKIVVQQQ